MFHSKPCILGYLHIIRKAHSYNPKSEAFRAARPQVPTEFLGSFRLDLVKVRYTALIVGYYGKPHEFSMKPRVSTPQDPLRMDII